MKTNKVRVNGLYIYNAKGFDRSHPTSTNNLENGTVVRVINLPGAPKANTMGQCYVGERESGKFLCMVSTASLTPLSEVISKLKAQVAQLARIENGIESGKSNLQIVNEETAVR